VHYDATEGTLLCIHETGYIFNINFTDPDVA